MSLNELKFEIKSGNNKKSISNYVNKVISSLAEGFNTVVLEGKSKEYTNSVETINKTVSILEILKRRIKNLNHKISLKWTDLKVEENGKVSKKHSISIVLVNNELSTIQAKGKEDCHTDIISKGDIGIKRELVKINKLDDDNKIKKILEEF